MGDGSAFIGLGSNLGGRIANLSAALFQLGAVDGLSIVAVSGIYETSPVESGGGYFLNAVARVETTLVPMQLLKELLVVESSLGRARRPGQTDPRSIDLDLLLYGETVIHVKDLILPHPRMLSRRFVMEPLSELEPDLKIPPTGITAAQAAAGLEAKCPGQEVKLLGTLEEVKENLKFEI